MSDEQQAKEVQPLTLEKSTDEGSPMTMNRPDWVTDRPPVGSSEATVEPTLSTDPTVINQPSAQGKFPADPGTPVTIDEETGFPTGATSVAILEANEQKADENEKAAEEAADAPADSAPASPSDGEPDAATKAEAEQNVVPAGDGAGEAPKTEGGSLP